MKNRVVITGMGVKSSVGNFLEPFWENIKKGRHGITRIEDSTNLDVSKLKVKVAAPDPNFDPNPYLSKKEQRRNDRYCQLAVAAAIDAKNDAGEINKYYDPFDVGVIISSGGGGFSTFERDYSKYLEYDHSHVPVFFVPMMLSNMGAGMVSIVLGFKGDCYSIASACSSANHAIGEAFHKIRDGYLKACIAGGAEGAITEFVINAFDKMTALSRSDDPNRASIPFDKERDGFVIAEGAGILMLENLEDAKKRNAHIYAEIVGYGATDDAYHITSPDIEAIGPLKAMEKAITDAGIEKNAIDYINAHGTSTGPNDKVETKAIKKLFGEHAKELAISSTKSMTGHMLGATSAVEAIICAKALEESVIPPTVGYQVPDEECNLDYVTEGARKQNLQFALSNSLGFGGHNSTLCFKRYESN